MDALWEMEAVGEDTERVVAKIECERLDLVTDYTTWHLRALQPGTWVGTQSPLWWCCSSPARVSSQERRL